MLTNFFLGYIYFCAVNLLNHSAISIIQTQNLQCTTETSLHELYQSKVGHFKESIYKNKGYIKIHQHDSIGLFQVSGGVKYVILMGLIRYIV